MQALEEARRQAARDEEARMLDQREAVAARALASEALERESMARAEAAEWRAQLNEVRQPRTAYLWVGQRPGMLPRVSC